MKNLLTKIAVIGSLIGTILIGGATTTFGALRVVQTPTYHLYSGESGTATSARIAPYPIDLDGVKLTITDLGTTPTITIDPKISGVEEIESFTGITDNGDNTATLTGVSRDLQSKYPYTGTGTGKTHGSGATVVFGNNPQLYGRLAAMENANTFTAIQTFTSTVPPRYDVDPGAAYFTTAPATVLINLAQLNRTASAGAANASETVNGLVQLATVTQAASSTSIGSTGARLALPASMATSSNDVVGIHIVATQNSGKINWNLIDLGTVFTSTALDTFSGGLTSTGTTTISASSLTTNPLTINTLPYKFPSLRAASGTVLMENGSGGLTFEPLVNPTYATTSLVTLTGTATSSVFSIPAGVLTASSTITAQGQFKCSTNGGCTMNFADNSGDILATFSMNPTNTGGTWDFPFFITLTSNGLNSQYTIISGMSYQGVAFADYSVSTGKQSSVNFATVTGFEFAVTTAGGSILNYNIIVRP